MKKIMFILVVLVLQTLYAQDSMIEESKTSSNNTFGAAVVKYSKINGQGAFLLGARGGWMANNSLAIGAGVYGLVSSISVRILDKDRSESNSDDIDLIYGGAEGSYMFTPTKNLHFAPSVLLGMGKLSVNYPKTDKLDNYINDFHGGDIFLVVEPGISLMANLTVFLRFDLAISYRITSGINDPSIAFEDISGLTGILALRLGNF